MSRYHSTFYSDGWNDCANKSPYSPPSIPIYALEYTQGYNDCALDDDEESIAMPAWAGSDITNVNEF